jgi:hypothetical protein
MTNAVAETVTTNIVPVQAIFDENGVCVGLVGPGGEFFSPPLSSDTITNAIITNSTINSSVIGAITPAAGTFSTMTTGNAQITGGSITGVSITITSLNNTPVGNLVPSTGAFTTLASTDLTVTNLINGSISGNAATATLAANATNAAHATTADTATTATTATNIAGGSAGSLPYQTSTNATTFLSAGSNGQVLTLASGVPSWATPTTGTVTSIATSGSVSGITLTGGPITSSGTITLGGALDLSSPPVIGGTTPNTITGTTITANTKFVSSYFDAANSAGGALRNASGTSQLQWGGGGGNNLSLDVSTNMNGANAQIDISPTGTGHVHIKPTGTGSIEIAPTNAGTLDNLVVGGTTPLAGTFTTLRFNTTLSVNGSTGTSGQVLTSSGSGLPTWTTPTAYATVTDDTTTNATRYPLFAAATSGNLTTEYTSSTKYQFNPSTGVLTATQFSGSGAGLTSIPNSALTNSSVTVGSTAIALGASATTIAGLVSVTSTTFVGALTGNASSATAATTATNATNTAITDDTTTNATFYPTFVSNTTGNLPQTVSSTKLKYNPSTGALTVSQLIIAP